MGVIQRQTIKNNLIAYLAVMIGALASLYIYPLNLELKGYADALLKWALLIFPLMSLGMSVVIVRFLPYMEEDPKVAGYRLLTRGLVAVTLAVGLLALFNLTLGETFVTLIQKLEWKPGKLATDRWAIIGLVAAMAYASVLTAYLKNLRRIALPAVFTGLLPKLGLPALVLLYVYADISVSWFITGLVGVYFLGTLGLLVYTATQGGLELRWGKLPLKGKTNRDMYSLAGFSIIGSLGSVLATHLDTLSINNYIGDFDTGVYSFAVFVTTVIAIPYKAVESIAAPIISSSWKEKDVKHLGFIYRETSSVLFAVGGLIYTGAVVCLPYVYDLTANTPQYAVGYSAALFLGAGLLIDQLTSLNGTLIGYSDYYRWNIVFVLLMGGINLLLNYIFIVQLSYGIVGAAAATAISLFVFNITKVIFLWVRAGIHPFTWSALWTGMVLLAVGALAYFLPLRLSPLLNLLIRGGLIALLFLAYLRFTNGVPPLKRVLRGGVKAMFQ